MLNHRIRIAALIICAVASTLAAAPTVAGTPSPEATSTLSTPATSSTAWPCVVSTHGGWSHCEYGALYHVPGNEVFSDYAKHAGQTSLYVTGTIDSYGIDSERFTDYPAAVISFTSDTRESYGGIILVSYPLNIGGETYVCNTNRTSKFAALFHVCESLPSSVMAPHHVRLRIYEVAIGGHKQYATDHITTLQDAPPSRR